MPITQKKVLQYVEDNINNFHDKRIKSLDKLKLTDVLKRKNPYLYKAKNLTTAEQIIRSIVDAYLSSQEETIFGDWLEGLAIYINKIAYKGWKSGIQNIDLEFDNNNIRYIVNIKSGPNWGNSSQIKKMKSDFNTAIKTLRTSNSQMHIIAINGCCYGKCPKTDKGSYFKYCGQDFWEFISGDTNLYIDIIIPLGHKAKETNNLYTEMYSNMINRFTIEFATSFCHTSGAIDWEKLVIFNSASSK